MLFLGRRICGRTIDVSGRGRMAPGRDFFLEERLLQRRAQTEAVRPRVGQQRVGAKDRRTSGRRDRSQRDSAARPPGGAQESWSRRQTG